MAAETKLIQSIFCILTGALRHRWWLRLLLLLVLLLSAVLIVQGHFGNDLAEMLPDGSRSAAVYRRISNSPMFNKVVVLLSWKDRVSGNSILSGQMEALAERLEKLPLVTRVDFQFYPDSITASVNALTASIPQLTDSSVFSLLTEKDVRDRIRGIARRMYLPTASGMTDLLRGDPFQLNHSLFRKLNDFREITGLALHPNYHYLVSTDENHVMLLLETNVPVSDAGKSRELLTSLRKELRNLPDSVSSQLISGHQHALANEDILKKDVGTVGVMSVLLFTLLFILFYRCDFRSLMIPVLPVLASVIVLGLMTLCFSKCLFFVVGMGGVVVSLAVDYGIHLYAAYRGGAAPHRRLAGLVPAVFAGALTSALAFGLFLFSRISACRQLGFFAGISLLLSFFLMLLILPAFLNRRQRCDTVFQAFRFPLKYPVICTVGWILLCVAALLSFGWLGFQMDIRRFDATPKEILQSETDYERIFQTGKRPAMLLVSKPTPDEALKAGAQTVDILRRASGRDHFFSPSDLNPPSSFRKSNLASWKAFQKSGSLDQLERRMRGISVEYGMKEEFFDPFFRNLKHGIQNPPEKPAELFRPILEKLVSKDKDGLYTCALMFPDTPENTALAARLFPGLPMISQEAFPALMSREVSQGILQLALMTAVIVLLIAYLFFRSFFKTFLAMLPVGSALLLTGAFFAVTGIPVSLSSLIAGIILVGLSIDYGILMVHSGFPEQDSITFHALTLSAATSAAGGATVIFTTHPMLRDAGFTLIIGISAAWAASVILLPALWQLHLRSRMRKLTMLLWILPLLFLASCRTVPFEHPDYGPPPPVSEASAWMERYRASAPNACLMESGVVLEHFFQSFTILGLLRLENPRDPRITAVGLNPGGARLFELSGVARTADLSWWLPGQPWSGHEQEASRHVMEVLFDIYTENLPPENTVFVERNGMWLAEVPKKNGSRMEYSFAGNPPRLIQKRIYRDGSPCRTISYYRYLSENGRMLPADILLEQGFFSYRLVIRTRRISEVPK